MIGCVDNHDSAQLTFDLATKSLRSGHARQCQDQATQAYRKYRGSNPTWAWNFLILQAQAALEQGFNEEVLTLLESDPPPSDKPDMAIPALMLAGVAHGNKHEFQEAQISLAHAAKLCETSALASCGYVLQARGLLASEQSDFRAAEAFYQLSVAFSRAHGDSFLEANALLNLGAESLAQGRYDEAIDRSEAADVVAKAADAGILELVSQGNIGWAYYKLGEPDRALDRLLSAERRAAELGALADQGGLLNSIGYVYLDAGNFTLAEQYFRRSLKIEQGAEVDRKEHIYNAQRALARLAVQTGRLDDAAQYADQAINEAKNSKSRLNQLYPLLIQGQIAARQGKFTEAERTFREVERDKLCPIFLKWEAQHSLALLYEDGKRSALADREYRAALATFEAARADVRHEDFHLSFLTNGWRIYDDYIHFLVAQGKPNDALRWADQSRARTLSEGLGYLTKGAVTEPSPLNAADIARRRNATLLFYWLGEKQSYLWSITPQKTSIFPLPPSAAIDAAVQRYRDALTGPGYALANRDADGLWLYETLLAPAKQSLPKNSTVYLIPDGSLNNLNFETLLVPEPKLHYWIEDATVASASSLHMLGAPYVAAKKTERRLLLVGDSIAPNDKYPEVAGARAQVESVASHFPDSQRRVISRAAATPNAYLESHPQQYTDLHFVAHGIASRLSPLDSAIVLSRPSPDSDAFKLYAREIKTRPLQADLVAISACYGTGTRTFAGEGLVGLSWAFLRAGAHNVVAALWDASGDSTEKLMARFYEELDRGESKAVALRTAKLSLLQDDKFSSPFHWAVFQLYTQGQPGQFKPVPAKNRALRTARYDRNRVTSPAAIPSATTTE